jgi:hypothetical protein
MQNSETLLFSERVVTKHELGVEEEVEKAIEADNIYDHTAIKLAWLAYASSRM